MIGEVAIRPELAAVGRRGWVGLRRFLGASFLNVLGVGLVALVVIDRKSVV